MRRLLIKLLLTLLGEYSAKCYTGINEEKKDDWLLSLTISDGFKNYFAYRDLQILKTMAGGVDKDTYWRLVGQRLELLFMAGESTRVYERDKKSSSRKRASEDGQDSSA